MKITIHRGIFVLLLSALFYAYEFIHRLAPSAMVPELMLAYDVSAAQLGLLSAMYFYCYGACQIPAGILVDRYRLEYILPFAALLISAGSIIQAISESYTQVLIARGLIGIGSSFSFIACVKLGTSWFDKKNLPIVVGVTDFFGVIGGFLGGLPLIFLLTFCPWQEVYWISALLGVLFAVMLRLFIRRGPLVESPSSSLAQPKGELIHHLRCPQTRLYGIYAALLVAPIAAFGELWSIPFFESVYGYTRSTASFVNAHTFFGIAIGGPLLGWLAAHTRLRVRTIMLVSTATAFLTFLLVIAGPDINFINPKLLLFIYGFATSNMLLVFSLATRLFSHAFTGIAIGFINTFITIIGALFQPLIGQMIDILSQPVSNIGAFQGHAMQLSLLPLPLCLILAFILGLYIKDYPMHSNETDT